MKSTIPTCKVCSEEFSPKRFALGYRTCLTCGAKEAAQQTARKARCTAPAYNKGAYMYVTNRTMARDLGR